MSNEFPRVNELRGLVKNPTSPEAYFQNFEQTVSEEPLKKRQFLDLEHELQGLDSAAWEHLKKELVPLLQKKHPTRGWQALFDKWNHAKAYNYLTRAGYSAIRFIPESRVSGQRTPDLEANLADTKALCEVKTINISENEARRRTCGGVGKTEAELADGFYNKLAKDLQDAKKQMAIYSGETLTKKIAYIIVNFDDLFHEYVDVYKRQIDAFIATNPVPELEVVFDIKPSFYTAMS